MRPRSELRAALLDALPQVPPSQAHFRALAPFVPGVNPQCRSELELVRRTLVNMASAGEISRAGTVRRDQAGRGRPLTLYRTVQPTAQSVELAAVMQRWMQG